MLDCDFAVLQIIYEHAEPQVELLVEQEETNLSLKDNYMTSQKNPEIDGGR